MAKTRNEVGRINGVYYKLIYDQRKNQHACDPEYMNQWAWFLWIGGNTDDYYEGEYATKKEAYSAVEKAGQ